MIVQKWLYGKSLDEGLKKCFCWSNSAYALVLECPISIISLSGAYGHICVFNVYMHIRGILVFVLVFGIWFVV